MPNQPVPLPPAPSLQVEQALCGVEALEFLSRSNILPDVILLDIMMPDMNGYEVWGSVGSVRGREDVIS